jgi:hypothetical protein
MPAGFQQPGVFSEDFLPAVSGRSRERTGQDLENPLDNWLLKRSADGFFALKETV